MTLAHGFGMMFSSVRVIIDIKRNSIMCLVGGRNQRKTKLLVEFSVSSDSTEYNGFLEVGGCTERGRRCRDRLSRKSRILDGLHNGSELEVRQIWHDENRSGEEPVGAWGGQIPFVAACVPILSYPRDCGGCSLSQDWVSVNLLDPKRGAAGGKSRSDGICLGGPLCGD